MSIKIGINGSASFSNVKDVIFGTSKTSKTDVNFVKGWNGTIIWQRDTRVELNSSNTSFNYQNSWSNESSAKYYQPTPYPYASTKGDGHITYTGGSYPITLTEGTHYDVSWINNRVPATGEWTSTTPTTGTGTMRITGKGSYKGTIDSTFSISYAYKADVKDITGRCTINLASSSKTLTDTSASYTATDSDLTINVSSVYYDTTLMTSGTDYTVTYTYPSDRSYSHTSEGQLEKSVTVTITGIGNYTGTATTTYKVYHSYAVVKQRVWATYLWNSSASGTEDGKYLFTFPPNSGTLSATWKEIDAYIQGVAYGNEMNVAITKTSCKYSKNGDSWTGSTTGLTSHSAIYFTGSKFIIGGDNGSSICFVTSSDGINWSTPVAVSGAPSSSYVSAITSHGNTIFAYNGRSTTSGSRGLCKSADGGATWSFIKGSIGSRDASLCYANNGCIYGAGQTSATSDTTDIYKIDASSGTSITLVKTIATNGPNRMASNGSTLVVASSVLQPTTTIYQHTIHYSTDYGSTWSRTDLFKSSDIDELRDIRYINGAFYLLTCQNRMSWKIYSSSNGITWSLWITESHSSSPGYVVDRLPESTAI